VVGACNGEAVRTECLAHLRQAQRIHLHSAAGEFSRTWSVFGAWVHPSVVCSDI
jgi:hypothetical protein